MQTRTAILPRPAALTAALLALSLAVALPVARAGGHDKGPSHDRQGADIVDTAVSAGAFNTLVTAVKAAGLVDALKGDGPLTVFAPTDEAFAKLPAGTVENLLKPENVAQLRQILLYHVVDGKVMAADIGAAVRATTLQGAALDIRAADGNVPLNDAARVVTADVKASNGVIHVIDTVVLPPAD